MASLGALCPALLNVAAILSAVFLHNMLDVPVTALAYGVLLGGILQLLFLLPRLISFGLFPRFIIDWRDPVSKNINLDGACNNYISRADKCLVNSLLAST